MRLFIAIPLAPEIEAKIASLMTELKKHDGAVKWVEPNNLHFTLRFLGETTEAKLPQLKSAISEIASRYQKIETKIDMLSAFPNLRQPRAIWCGIASGLEALKLIVSEIENAVITIGFSKEEKAFKAHLTLGRVRDGADATKLANHLIPYRLIPIPISLDRIVLFKSTLTPTGPIYERLHTSELGKSAERFE